MLRRQGLCIILELDGTTAVPGSVIENNLSTWPIAKFSSIRS